MSRFFYSIFALIACASLSACSGGDQSATSNSPTPNTATSTNSPGFATSGDELGGEIKQKIEGDPVSQAEELISSCVAAKSIHDFVAKKYGAVSPKNFGAFFTSAEFRDLLKKKTTSGGTVEINWLDQAPADTNAPHNPNSILLYSDSSTYIDSTRYNEKGESTGGSGHELHVLYSKETPES